MGYLVTILILAILLVVGLALLGGGKDKPET